MSKNALPAASTFKNNSTFVSSPDKRASKRERPFNQNNYENDNQEDPAPKSAPKKAKVENLIPKSGISKDMYSKLEANEEPHIEHMEITSDFAHIYAEIEATRQKNAELEKALATLEAKAQHKKEKKIARKKAIEEENAKVAEFLEMLEKQEAEKLKVMDELQASKVAIVKLKSENTKLKKVLYAELESQIVAYQDYVMELDEKIIEKQGELLEVNLYQNQIPFNQIVNLMEKVCSTPKSEKYSTQITFSEGEAKLISIGRAPTIGESTSQLAHIIPYGLVEHLVKRVVKLSETFDDRMKLLIQDILPFFKHDKGICIRKSELEKFRLNDESAKSKAFASYTTCNDTYFLIEENYMELIDKPLQTAQIEEDYAARKQYFIRSVLTYLKDLIHDNNTKQFFCETLSCFILNLFNKKPNGEYPASYSTKGNISELEIRLYDNVDDARTAKTRNFEVARACDLNGFIENGEDLNGRIRLVANSGNKVKDALEALAILNEIISLVLDADDPTYLIDEYNASNIQIMLSNSDSDLSAYNSPLTHKNFKTEIQEHIAKQAFVMCGYKALEDKVLVRTKDEKAIKIFIKATGTDYAFFEIQDGPTFRSEERKAIKASHPMRTEETDLNFLAHMVVKFIELLTLTYESFKIGFTDFDECYPLLLLRSFTSIITKDQKIDFKQFFENNVIPLAKNWIESDYSNSSFSEIECSAGYIPLYEGDHF